MEEIDTPLRRLSVHTGAFEKSAVMLGRCGRHLVETLFVIKESPLENSVLPDSMSQSIVIFSRSPPSLNEEHGWSYPILGNPGTISSVVTTRK
jgi:hypothetical protein